ncbi:MAG: hypothetical protein ACKO1F_04675 [Flammeovirgaceae bacterium]
MAQGILSTEGLTLFGVVAVYPVLWPVQLANLKVYFLTKRTM